MHDDLVSKIQHSQDTILDWLDPYFKEANLPLYSSIDIRDDGFKISVVDTNIFPAGFNNICHDDLKHSSITLKQSILKRVPTAKKVLLVVESHTRNKWYLENVYILSKMLSNAGFSIILAAPSLSTTINIHVTDSVGAYLLGTANGHEVAVHDLEAILVNGGIEKKQVDLIVLNNDFFTGVPSCLKSIDIPIYPSIEAGWHTRQKNIHYQYQRDLFHEFSKLLDMDPWLLTCLDAFVSPVDINNLDDREKIADVASELFNDIQVKYREYGIKDKPFIFLKSNHGTYGMGVLALDNPKSILSINRKTRNQLATNKNSRKVTSYILQEGVQSIYKRDEAPAEVCLYQIDHHYIGSFYRIHKTKSKRDNLNSPGVYFSSIGQTVDSPCEKSISTDILGIYKLLGQIACVACLKEIQTIQTERKNDIPLPC